MNLMMRIIYELVCFVKKDGIILNYPGYKASKNQVNIDYYRADLHDGIDANLGDYLSEIVVHWMCKRMGIMQQRVHTRYFRHLYAIGSILQMGYQNATIWGTGFAFELNGVRAILTKKRNLDIRCVRGPKTRKTLLRLGFDCPPVYGDPAVLMPLIVPKEHRPTTDYLIIPHFSKELDAKQRYGEQHILSMNTKNYKYVIDRICNANKIVSSSLHGIILAEAYGVPAVFYQDRPQKFNYKYEDYYESTERYGIKLCKSVEEAMNIEVNNVDLNLKAMQKALINSFPIDLWE